MREVSLGWCLENEVQRKDDSKLHVLYIKGKSLFVIQGVPGGKVNILGGHSIGHPKQKSLYEHVSYSEPFQR
jgi:hypothetical protein